MTDSQPEQPQQPQPPREPAQPPYQGQPPGQPPYQAQPPGRPPYQALPPGHGGPPYPTGQGYPPYAPPAPMSPEDQRLWGTLAHLSGLLFHVLGALVVYLVVKDRGAFVRSQSAEALNFWITVDLALFASVLLFIVAIGLVTFVLVAVAAVVLPIVAAIAANRGEDYRYPVNLRLVH